LHAIDHTFLLDGTSTPIHATNEIEELVLDDDTVTDYLHFFMYFLRADEGAFVLVESPDEVTQGLDADADADADAEPGTRTLEEVQKLATPVTWHKDAGRWVFDATVAYDATVFKASIAVDPSGLTEMIDDDPVGALGSLVVVDAPALELSERSAPAAAPDSL